ncbi:MAG: anthranilate synthase component I family protein [Methanomicrobiaceae archaeon]|nr:anthranilate synthase component I family protein [Methanomicrobiaceae archaeon]
MGSAVAPTACTEEPRLLVLPITEEIPVPSCDPYTLYRSLGIRKGYILESMEGLPRRAIRSIIGLEPDLILSLDEPSTCEGDPPLASAFLRPAGDDPIARLRDLSTRLTLPGTDHDGFIGGFVGYCAYDMVGDLCPGIVQAGRVEGSLARFMLSTRGIVFDHVAGSCTLFDVLLLGPGDDQKCAASEARERMKVLREQVAAAAPQDPGAAERGLRTFPTSFMGQEEFSDLVRQAKEYILAGDIFQVVLSRKITCPFTGDPLAAYGVIREINPSPYLYYLHFGDEVIIGSSPEMLVRSEGRSVQTVPIAGTRPRGRDAQEDERLARELLSDEKERAEHLMLVDLARNDIGRVSAFGSVRIPEFFGIEKFSHVQHIASRVTGTLKEGYDRFDALAACFPAGTVSGAPKIRAMQIIAELEPHPRGLYAGAVGYAGFTDLLEFAIAIRTIRVSGGWAEFSTGAGIVADSVPEKEYEETEHKARAMLQAVTRGDGTV